MRDQPQQEVHRQLRSEMHRAHTRITEIARALDPEQLVRRPAPGKWSVAHVLEHLLLMDELFLRAADPLVRGARRDAAAPARLWRPSFIGGRGANAPSKP